MVEKTRIRDTRILMVASLVSATALTGNFHLTKEFVRIMSFRENEGPREHKEFDGYTSRQMFLRSYTFSRKETVPQKTKKCFGKVKEKMSGMVVPKKKIKTKKNASVIIKIRDKIVDSYYAAMAAIFHRLLACTTSVDVRDQSLTENC